jgi:hypothetical protein
MVLVKNREVLLKGEKLPKAAKDRLWMDVAVGGSSAAAGGLYFYITTPGLLATAGVGCIVPGWAVVTVVSITAGLLVWCWRTSKETEKLRQHAQELCKCMGLQYKPSLPDKDQIRRRLLLLRANLYPGVNQSINPSKRSLNDVNQLQEVSKRLCEVVEHINLSFARRMTSTPPPRAVQNSPSEFAPNQVHPIPSAMAI